MKMQEIQKRNEQKLNADLEERMRIIELKAQRDEQEKEMRRQQVEQRIKERNQARQKSIGEMVHRTK